MNNPARLLVCSFLIFLIFGFYIVQQKHFELNQIRQRDGPTFQTGAHCGKPWRDSLSQFPHEFPAPTSEVYESNAQTSCGLRYRFFIIHAANWHLTLNVLNFLKPELGGGRFIVIVDTSLTEDTSMRENDLYLRRNQIMVIRPRVVLGLGAGMEIIRRVAMELGVDFMLYSHNDANFTRSGLIAQAASAVCRYHREKPQWGVLTFRFDVFCAYRTEAFRKTGMWDPYVLTYKADFDYYHRLRCAGFTFEQYDSPNIGDSIIHLGSQTIHSINQVKSIEHQFGFLLFDSFSRFVYFWSKWSTNLEPWHAAAKPFHQPFNGVRQLQTPLRVDSFAILCWLWIDHKNELLIAVFFPWICIIVMFSGCIVKKLFQTWRSIVLELFSSAGAVGSEFSSADPPFGFCPKSRSRCSNVYCSGRITYFFAFTTIFASSFLLALLVVGFKSILSDDMGGICY